MFLAGMACGALALALLEALGVRAIWRTLVNPSHRRASQHSPER